MLWYGWLECWLLGCGWIYCLFRDSCDWHGNTAPDMPPLFGKSRSARCGAFQPMRGAFQSTTWQIGVFDWHYMTCSSATLVLPMWTTCAYLTGWWEALPCRAFRFWTFRPYSWPWSLHCMVSNLCSAWTVGDDWVEKAVHIVGKDPLHHGESLLC